MSASWTSLWAVGKGGAYDELVRHGGAKRIRDLVGILAHAAGAHMSDGMGDARLPAVAVMCLRGLPFHPAVSSRVPPFRGAGAAVGGGVAVAAAILPARPSTPVSVRGRETAVKVGELFCGAVARVGVCVGVGFGVVVGAVERRGTHRQVGRRVRHRGMRMQMRVPMRIEVDRVRIIGDDAIDGQEERKPKRVEAG